MTKQELSAIFQNAQQELIKEDFPAKISAEISAMKDVTPLSASIHATTLYTDVLLFKILSTVLCTDSAISSDD